MCLAKVYLRKNGKKTLLLEEVSSIDIDNRKLLVSTLFGEQKEIEGEIRKIDFQNASVVLEISG